MTLKLKDAKINFVGDDNRTASICCGSDYYYFFINEWYTSDYDESGNLLREITDEALREELNKIAFPKETP